MPGSTPLTLCIWGMRVALRRSIWGRHRITHGVRPGMLWSRHEIDLINVWTCRVDTSSGATVLMSVEHMGPIGVPNPFEDCTQAGAASLITARMSSLRPF